MTPTKQWIKIWIVIGCGVIAFLSIIIYGVLTSKGLDGQSLIGILSKPGPPDPAPKCVKKVVVDDTTYKPTKENDQLVGGIKHYFYAKQADGRYAWFITFTKAYEMCINISIDSNLLSLRSREEEDKFDAAFIEFVDDQKTSEQFYNYRPQIWTAAYYNLELDNATEIQWANSDGPLYWYQNFCNPEAVEAHLKELRDVYRPGMNPIVYIVKDYTKKATLEGPYDLPSSKRGCWKIYDSIFFETETLVLNWVCQSNISTDFHSLVPSPPGEFVKIENIKSEVEGDKTVEREYVPYHGNISYVDANKTCTNIDPDTNSMMLAPNSRGRESDIDQIVMKNKDRIFGFDDGNPKWLPLVWTGGYFNLSANDTTRVRWTYDKNAATDAKEKTPISYGLPFLNNDNLIAQKFENFCSPLEKVIQLLADIKATYRDMSKTDGCVIGQLVIIVKDYRKDQVNQGCWHVYEYDYLFQNDIKLFLMCQKYEREFGRE